MPFENRRTNARYGLALDLGTTTMEMALWDLWEARELGRVKKLNPQRRMGPDVMSRISFVMEKGEEAARLLQMTVCQGINLMARELWGKLERAVGGGEVETFVVSANCVMLHLLLGRKVTGMGMFPFKPEFTEGVGMPARDVGIFLPGNPQMLCLPSASAFVGADAVAGYWAVSKRGATGHSEGSSASSTGYNRLFLDIGTNGEMILETKGKLLACSCAAGPALEGMSISCGMGAFDGAVQEATLLQAGQKRDPRNGGNELSWRLKTLGGGEPLGLCGSGVLHMVRELLREGILDDQGLLHWKEEGERQVILSRRPHPVAFTQQDVRQVQLAKGALLSGILSLLKEANLPMDALDQVVIAGQLGTHLPEACLIDTGVLPQEFRGKVLYGGNTSLMGAGLALLSEDARRGMDHLARRIRAFDLAILPGYESLFLECLAFPHSIALETVLKGGR